jgi:hypothetical protein
MSEGKTITVKFYIRGHNFGLEKPIPVWDIDNGIVMAREIEAAGQKPYAFQFFAVEGETSVHSAIYYLTGRLVRYTREKNPNVILIEGEGERFTIVLNQGDKILFPAASK